jgi:hypothetical protein
VASALSIGATVPRSAQKEDTMIAPSSITTFPPFSLARLLRTVFAPRPGERLALLIDLPDPVQIRNFAYLAGASRTPQGYAYTVLYNPLQRGVLRELGLRGGEMFAYRETGGSNLDLPDRAYAPDGRALSLERDVYPRYDIVLCVSTYSATAPLTAFAKQYGFRGATMHGLNPAVVETGLAVDYEAVSRDAETLRLGMTRADRIALDFAYGGRIWTLRLELGRQEAQKSHGLCRGEPDIVNLPAGEVYYVPVGGEGAFPRRFEDGTIGLMIVLDGRIAGTNLLCGNPATLDAYDARLCGDPATGILGELGFGTQVLPVSGAEIQDEKILGTLHVAPGRNDHLGGDVGPRRFVQAQNASHDDVLFSPATTPEINVPQVRMQRDGQEIILFENYAPAAYIEDLLG